MRLKFLPVLLLLAACGPNQRVETTETALTEDRKFFPVTSFLKGQVVELKEASINPLMFVTRQNRTDSSWLRIEDTERHLQIFLSPEIDSMNMIPWFEETRFLDQTINAFTFSYMPKKQLPDSLELRRWDIYVDPANGKVQRVYIVRQQGQDTYQLTWQTGVKARIVTLTDSSGTPVVKEEKEIIWDF